jgi:hypothetical protein
MHGKSGDRSSMISYDEFAKLYETIPEELSGFIKFRNSLSDERISGVSADWL